MRVDCLKAGSGDVRAFRRSCTNRDQPLERPPPRQKGRAAGAGRPLAARRRGRLQAV